MHREGLVHDGFEILVGGERHRIDSRGLTGGKQRDGLRPDRAHARPDGGARGRRLPTVYEAADVAVHGFDGAKPHVTYRQDGREQRLDCDFIAGCDGFHGVCRASVPQSAIAEYEKVYPFGWLGVLSETPPVSDELIYVNSPRGFALCSMRSRTRSRYYLQVPLTEQAEDWTRRGVLGRAALRLDDAGPRRARHRARRSRRASRRCAASSPSRCASAGCSSPATPGHIVPPTGAKGLNLAATDVNLLAGALIEHYQRAQRRRARALLGALPAPRSGGPSASRGGSPR